MTIRSFEIISVPVADPQRAKAFYRDVLGFELVREAPMGPGMVWIQLAPPGQTVTIALVTWFEQMKPGGLQGVMLNSDDLDVDHALLRSREADLMSTWTRSAWGRDDYEIWVAQQQVVPA